MRRNRSGFTLIELMLAMTFVSILLIAIAMLTIYISNLYTRGITLRQVNEAGLAISTDVQRTMQNSPSFDPTINKDSYVLQKDGATPEIAGGRLCLGQYSYAWNYGKFINQYSTQIIRLPNYFTGAVSPPIRLVKVVDPTKSLCKPTSAPGVVPATYGPISNNANGTIELLANGDRDLAVQKFELKGSETKKLYSISLMIGTNETVALDSVGNCKPPVDTGSNLDYCAVNEFDIVARTGR